MNLSTARSEKRAKEVGVRKTLGGGQGSLILQFFVESTLLVLAALGWLSWQYGCCSRCSMPWLTKTCRWT